MREFVQETYESFGRPSIDSVVFFKLQLVTFFEAIRVSTPPDACPPHMSRLVLWHASWIDLEHARRASGAFFGETLKLFWDMKPPHFSSRERIRGVLVSHPRIRHFVQKEKSDKEQIHYSNHPIP